MKKTMKLGVLSSLLLASTAQVASAEEIRISVAVAPMKNIFSKIKEPFEKSTGIKLIDVNGNPEGVPGEQALKDVDQDKAEAAMGGLDWDSWLAVMKQKNYPIKSPERYAYRVIGRDRTQIITHKDVGVSELSETNIARLLSGDARSWKSVGGKDIPVQIVITKAQFAMMPYLQKVILGGKPVRTEDAKIATDLAETLKIIANTPGAIGWGPLGSLSSEVLAPKHQTIGRPMILIFKGSIPPKLETLRKFIEKEGQRYGVTR